MSGTYRLVGWGVVGQHTLKPIPGAYIHVLGTALTVTTDDFGRYYIADAPADQDELQVRALGYQTVRMKFDRKKPIGPVVGPDAFTFTDTLNVWLHEIHGHPGQVRPGST